MSAASPSPADAIVFTQFGEIPLIVSLPHVGTELPAEVAAQLTPVGLTLVDTDWHVHHLYDFARDAGASWLQARYSRYAIDVNRPPDDQSLYPGQITSELCPIATFEGESLYPDAPPSPTEVARRREQYWVPYHAALRDLIERTRERFGYAVLLDAHSIRSVLPRLFPGRLPDVNLGTNSGHSCTPAFAAAVVGVLESQQRFSHVLNGRFKGGYITRAYGDPTARVQALQIELAQAAYMDEATTTFDAALAQPLKAVLRQVIEAMLGFAASAR